MLSGGDKKYDIGSDPLPPFETNFVLWATLNFMNGPLGACNGICVHCMGFSSSLFSHIYIDNIDFNKSH